MMKKMIFLLAAIVLSSNTNYVKAQNSNSQECSIKYNLFRGDVQTKNYDEAYIKLISLMDSCPKLSYAIYLHGDKVAKDRLKNASDKEEAFALVKRIYEQRVQYFPKKKMAKGHSDYATFLIRNEKASKEDIFKILEKAYIINATEMGVKNLYRYFRGITDKNKDSNPQKIFDTFDDVLEVMGKKLDDYSKKLKPLLESEEKGEELNEKDKKNLKSYTNNSKALGQVESGLNKIIEDLSTCERLIPLYTRDFEANKTNSKWLKRSVSRMYSKECTEDALYERLVEAWVQADPSPITTVYYAGILYKKGKESEATEYYKKAVEQELDAFKKADILYKIAQLYAKKGQKSKARNYANQAISNKRSMGKAYLLIASLYASSANSCGTTEFEKRMVYTAALQKVRRAVAVDPSIASKASKYIRNYKANEPSKKLLFRETIKTGTSHTIKCWIGETVKVSEK